MALEQKLSLRLAQKLVMTPSLQQAIKLLQMTRMELQNVLTQEMEENPLLEEADELFEEEEKTDSEKEESETAPSESEAEKESDQPEAMEEIDLEAYFSAYIESSSEPATLEMKAAPPLENTLTREPDLYDHLLWQIHMTETSARQREIAELIVGNLNPDGFLVATVDEICSMGSDEGNGGEFEVEEVEEALAFVRSLDPPGIAFETLRESLLHQLRDRGEAEDSLPVRVLAEAWNMFLKRQFAAIAKSFGLPLSDLEPVVRTIQELETRPGREFSYDRPHYVEPDVVVTKVGDEYVIQLNDDGMPRLRISNAYRRLLREMRADGRRGDARQFIQERLRSAVWLIKSIDQRQRTIYKVADSIIRQQREFMDHGVDHLRPMILRDVADDIGMHESTVSRVVSNKYMHTPRGVLPMKFFFHSGIDREYGSEISSRSVKRKIEQLVEIEDPRRPLSDSQLMEALRREGINIARRTVAKYRDELGIQSSTSRKAIF